MVFSLKEVAKLLSSSKERRETGLFVIEGPRMVREVLLKDNAVQCLIMTEGFSESDEGRAFAKCCEADSVDVSVIAENSMKKVSDTVSPAGVLAVVKKDAALSAGVSLSADLRKGFPLLFLEDIQDPGNLGTIMRSAEAAGVGKIVLSKGCVDPFSPKVVRSTMGSLLRVPFLECSGEDDFFESIASLKNEGFRFYAAALSGTKDYCDITYGKCAAFMIGNEGNGLSKKALDHSDETILIPMEGAAESLNAASAATILLFEASRQRRAGGNEQNKQ